MSLANAAANLRLVQEMLRKADTGSRRHSELLGELERAEADVRRAEAARSRTTPATTWGHRHASGGGYAPSSRAW